MTRSGIALIVLLGTVLGSSSSAALSYIGPSRPLTADEVLLDTCEKSDAIVSATIESIEDEFFAEVKSGDESGVFVPIATLTVLKSIKGPLHRRQRLRIQMMTMMRNPDDLRSWVPGSTVDGIVFINRWRGKTSDYRASKSGPLPRWVLCGGPFASGSGFLAAGGSIASLETRVQRAVRRIEPDSLASFVDAVVLGRVERGTESYDLHGKRVGCSRVTSAQQLYGTSMDAGLCVYSPSFGSIQPGRRLLLYLNRVARGVYEAVPLSVGAQKVDGYYVGVARRPLPATLEMIARAESRRSRKAGGH